MYWILGEPLYLSKDVEALAMEQQESHRESSGKEGMIRDFLEKQIPSNWEQQPIQQRRMFWSGAQPLGEGETLGPREKVCAVEIWAECFNGDPRFLKRSDSMEINNILAGIPGWERVKTPRRFGPYGQQKGFRRTGEGSP